MVFEFIPFRGFFPVEFYKSSNEILPILGPDYIENTASDGDQAYVYDDFTLVFSKSGVLVEACIGENCELIFKGRNLFAVANPASLLETWGFNNIKINAFTVFPSLGLAFSGFTEDSEYDKNISVFTRERIDDFIS